MKSLALLGLGSKYWKIAPTLEALPREVAIQVFDNTEGLFGNPFPNLRRLCKTGKVKVVEVQISYTKITHKLVGISVLRKRLPLWKAFAAEFPKITFYISHTTEHFATTLSSLRYRMDLIESFGFLAVNNPEPGRGAVMMGEFNETHKQGAFPGQYISSMDGLDVTGKADVLSWVRSHRNAMFRYGWGALCNLQDGSQPADPAKRKASPSVKYLKMLAHISECPDDAPSPRGFSASALKSPWLYKTMSQDTNDSREDKPLLIASVKADNVQLVTFTGARIGVFPYFGTYLDGMFRYYSGLRGGLNMWGYEIAQHATAISASPWVWFKFGNKYWGPVHPAFRAGYFEGGPQ